MIPARYEDKQYIVNILRRSFDANKSVNYLLKQDGSRTRRLRRLMEYSFEVCFAFGEVWLSADRSGCALIVHPDRKKTTLRSLYWDIRLAVGCLGFASLRKAMRREAAVHQLHPSSPFTYLWFIGVDPAVQQKGTGTALLNAVLARSAEQQRPVYLDTSVPSNVEWYQKREFTVYKELDFGYRLYCLKN
jgi:ribosomal protein S18 acetylase RimI-like enzyme